LARAKEEKPEEFPFGLFHLFMSPAGVADDHRDSNDFVSFLFVLKKEEGKGGALELGGLGVALNYSVGDCIIIDSRALLHGTRGYWGEEEERIVGLFVAHRSYLYKQGVTKEEVHNVSKKRKRKEIEDKGKEEKKEGKGEGKEKGKKRRKLEEELGGGPKAQRNKGRIKKKAKRNKSDKVKEKKTKKVQSKMWRVTEGRRGKKRRLILEEEVEEGEETEFCSEE
jgi:hypothetical protein